MLVSNQKPRDSIKTITKSKLFIEQKIASFNKWKICGLVFIDIKQINALKILIKKKKNLKGPFY